MSQLYRRIQRLETQIGLVSRGSLNALFQETERMVRNTSVSFEDAVMELVKGLDDQELNSIIGEVESRFGREIATHEHAINDDFQQRHALYRRHRPNLRILGVQRNPVFRLPVSRNSHIPYCWHVSTIDAVSP
jgi:hypothetical protein